MVKHVVMWNIEKENIKAVREKFESMTDKIPQILKVETGVNIDSEFTNKNLILITYHNSIDEVYDYQNHPYHQEVKEFVAHFLSNRACLDFKK